MNSDFIVVETDDPDYALVNAILFIRFYEEVSNKQLVTGRQRLLDEIIAILKHQGISEIPPHPLESVN